MALLSYGKRLMRRILDRWGYEVHRRPHVPKGMDVFQSLKSHWYDWRPTVIFDVGANVGQSVARIRPLYPRARIFSFEPVPATCEQLRKNVSGDSLVEVFALALADRAGEAMIQVHGASDQSSLSPGLLADAASFQSQVAVPLQTADAFCAQHGIDRIGILKVDVEGFELEVLRGARELLVRGAVDFMVLEAGLIPGNPRFTPLSALNDFLMPYGFVLIGIYEQHGMRYPQSAEFCNTLFAHQRHLTRSP